MNIYEALTAAKVELCGVGIGKDHENKHQRYKFRGIDDIYNVVGPLLTKHNILLSPLVEEVTHNTYPRENGVTQHFIVRVSYIAVCADDPEVAINIRVYGEGADTQDKAMNKAMTSAFKNCVFQLLMPPLQGTPLDMDTRTEVGDHPVDSEREDVPTGVPASTPVDTAKELAEGMKVPGTGNGLITEDQHKHLTQLILKANISLPALLSWAKVPDLRALPEGKFERVESELLKKVKDNG